MNPIGLQVVERQSSPTPTLVPGDLGNVAMVVQSPLGPEDVPVRITSLDDFRVIFGGPDTSYQSYYEVKGLFQNALPFRTNVYCVRAVDTGGTASSLQDGISPDLLTLERGYRGQVSPGVAGDNASVEVVAGAGGSFIMNVYLTNANGQEILVETITGITDDNLEGRINNRSKYIVATVTGSYTLVAITKTTLTTGVDPTYPTDLATADLTPFDNENVQLLFAPDYQTSATATVLEEYASGRGDMLALTSAPLAETPGTVSTFSTALKKAQSFLAGYFNWMKVDDELGGDGIYTPALGHIIGAYYLRKKDVNGGFAFVPPAGLTVSLRGILEQNQDLSSGDIENLVREEALNVLQFFRGYGFVVRTSRTMSTLEKHYSIHIRRSLNFLISSFRSQLGVFEQQQNNPDTWRQLDTTLTNFLFKEFQNGMFETLDGFEANVGVKVDETNNDEQTRQARQLVADIALNFAEVAETVWINIQQSEGQVTASVA